MFSVTYAQLNAWLTAFLWPFVRILAFVASAPVVGNTSVPMRVKIGLAAFVTLIVAPSVGPLPDATPFSGDGIWTVVNQFLTGLALGLSAQVAFWAVEMAGGVMGLGMGLGFAAFFDPQSDASSDVLARYLNTLAMLAFLAVDGHLQVIAALIETFRLAPVSADLLGAAGWRELLGWGGTVFSAGLLLALPVLAALLIANLALGILNRAAPQIGVFQIGFAVTLLVGLVLVQLLMPNMIPFFARLFDGGVEEIGRVAAALRPGAP